MAGERKSVYRPFARGDHWSVGLLPGGIRAQECRLAEVTKVNSMIPMDLSRSITLTENPIGESPRQTRRIGR